MGDLRLSDVMRHHRCDQVVVIFLVALSTAVSASIVTDLGDSTPHPARVELAGEGGRLREHSDRLRGGQLALEKHTGVAQEHNLSNGDSEPVISNLAEPKRDGNPELGEPYRRGPSPSRANVLDGSKLGTSRLRAGNHIDRAEASTALTPSARPDVSKRLGESSRDLPGFAGDGNYECPDKKCKNGGTLQNCQCICVNGWGGIKCGVCRINSGGGGRRLLADAQGDSDDESEDEEEKQKKYLLKHPPSIGSCAHGSFVKATCSCRCNADWSGLMCDGCKHPPCQNGGRLDKQSCSCKCVGYWTGKTCTQCKIEGTVPFLETFSRATDRTQMKCFHGDFIRPECRCKCDADWEGNFCTKCVHGPCGLHGELDPLVCRCNCALAWVGKQCTTCTHKFCKYPKKYGADSCSWVKEQLHCPGDGQLAAMPELVPLPDQPLRTGGVKAKKKIKFSPKEKQSDEL